MSGDVDSRGTLPVVDGETVATARDGGLPDATVAGVLLAAGASERFGEANKLVADLRVDTLVGRAARTLTGADLDRVIAVVGHDARRVREALSSLDLSIVENTRYRDGQASSIGAGLAAVRDADAAVFALGDMPWVDPATVDLLVDAFRAGLGDPLAAAFEGRRGNPVLFGERHFDALAALEGDRGGRTVLLASPDASLVETGDPGVRRDVDAAGDLRGLHLDAPEDRDGPPGG